jgi:anti-sigma regulatory factor (Ser/Thr protein kinase)
MTCSDHITPAPADSHAPLGPAHQPCAPPRRASARTGSVMPDLADLLATARQVAKPIRRVFPGRTDQARHARHFVARVLADCPAADTAVLLTSELVTNAVTHTRSSAHGTFQVVIWPGHTTAYIAVIDDGSHTTPAARWHGTAELSESGRGLELVNLLATRWGHYGDHSATTRTLVWFRLDWPPGDPCEPAR